MYHGHTLDIFSIRQKIWASNVIPVDLWASTCHTKSVGSRCFDPNENGPTRGGEIPPAGPGTQAVVELEPVPITLAPAYAEVKAAASITALPLIDFHPEWDILDTEAASFAGWRAEEDADADQWSDD